jgi:hypothetical protein
MNAALTFPLLLAAMGRRRNAAKENVNVDEAVTALVSAISKRTGGTGGAAAAPAPSQQQENIKVAGGQPAADNKSSDCSC